MYIHEAVKKAMEEDKLMIRLSAVRPDSERYAVIKPTNSYDACMLCIMGGGIAGRSCRCWNPTADDLTADDWTTIKEEHGKSTEGVEKALKLDYLFQTDREAG